MRTARALERHLEEDIVARHCVTIPRAPSVASGRALNAPHTPGEVVEGEGEVVTSRVRFSESFGRLQILVDTFQIGRLWAK